MKDPEIIVKNQPIDIELAELGGEKQTDFLNLCFDDEPLDFFGTPYDLPNERARFELLVQRLNDKDDDLWSRMFSEWRLEICKQFHLKIETYSKDFRPKVSFKIARVCVGYSQHLHAAIGLFSKHARKIARWGVDFEHGSFYVKLETRSGKAIHARGTNLPLMISTTIRDVLLTEKSKLP